MDPVDSRPSSTGTAACRHGGGEKREVVIRMDIHVGRILVC